LSNVLEPGWVPTKMGGPGAPDDIDQAHLTQAWLAASADPDAQTTAGYFYHLKPRDSSAQTGASNQVSTTAIRCDAFAGA
jgi:hypothetical protein